jgi:hypothetical protein
MHYERLMPGGWRCRKLSAESILVRMLACPPRRYSEIRPSCRTSSGDDLPALLFDQRACGAAARSRVSRGFLQTELACRRDLPKLLRFVRRHVQPIAYRLPGNPCKAQGILRPGVGPEVC